MSNRAGWAVERTIFVWALACGLLALACAVAVR